MVSMEQEKVGYNRTPIQVENKSGMLLDDLHYYSDCGWHVGLEWYLMQNCTYNVTGRWPFFSSRWTGEESNPAQGNGGPCLS